MQKLKVKSYIRAGGMWVFVLAVWLLFGGNLAQAQQILTLDSCRAMAVENNKLLKAESYKQQQAEAKLREVNINFFPKVSLQGAFVHMDKPVKLVDWDNMLGPFNILVPPMIRSLTTIDLDNIWVGNATLIQPLFMGGKIVAGHHMAAKAVSLSKTMAETKRTEVEQQVEETYWQVVTLKSKESLLIQLIKLLDDAVNDVDIAIKEGVATKADGLTIRVKRSEAEQNLLKVQNGLYLSRMLLAQQCGMGLNADYQVADEVDLEIMNIDTEVQAPMDSMELNRKVELRSEIRSLRLADTLFKHKERMETAAMLPKLALVGTYTTSKPNLFSAPRNNFDGTWGIALVMQVPITDIFTGVEKRKQAHAERMVKQQELAEAHEKISLQIKQTLLNNQEAHKQMSAARLNLNRAQENLRYAQIGYKEGVIPLLNLTGAQTAWAQAHDNLIDAVVALRLSECKIKHVIPQE